MRSLECSVFPAPRLPGEAHRNPHRRPPPTDAIEFAFRSLSPRGGQRGRILDRIRLFLAQRTIGIHR